MQPALRVGQALSPVNFFLQLLSLALTALAQPAQNFDSVQIQLLPVQGNVYMLAGAVGNITLQVGKDGVLMVDTGFAPLAPKIMAEIRKLSPGPIRYIINTHVHPDHVGGNDAFAKMIPLGPRRSAQDHRPRKRFEPHDQARRFANPRCAAWLAPG